jgi:tetratricopeptide (TPR) repeat protein
MLLAGLLVFMLAPLPTLGLTTFLFQQFSTVADRFVYLSMLGVALAAAWLASLRWTRPVAAACAIVLALLGGRSADQALTWRNRVTLYSHAVRVTPNSAASHGMLGVGYLLASRPDLALPQFRLAHELQPDDLGTRRNTAVALAALGRYSDAIAQMRGVLAMTAHGDPKLRAGDLVQLGVLLTRKGDPAAALPYFEQAYRALPDPRLEEWISHARERATTRPAATRRSMGVSPMSSTRNESERTHGRDARATEKTSTASPGPSSPHRRGR